MSNASPRIRSKPTRLSFTARRTDISTPTGVFRKERSSPDDKAVFEIEIQPEDGLYPLPYMARQANGQAWEEECTTPGAPAEQARQGFYPDGSRSFEEIDRLSVGAAGVGNLISSFADVDFYRVLPTGGYTKGLAGRAPHRHGRRRYSAGNPQQGLFRL